MYELAELQNGMFRIMGHVFGCFYFLEMIDFVLSCVCVNLCEKERLTTHGRQSSCLCVAGTHTKNMNAEYRSGYYTGVLQACRHSTPTQIQSPGSFIRR